MALCLRILLDVSKGLAHLHAIPLPHGALKATNVLLDQQYCAKVLPGVSPKIPLKQKHVFFIVLLLLTFKMSVAL